MKVCCEATDDLHASTPQGVIARASGSYTNLHGFSEAISDLIATRASGEDTPIGRACSLEAHRGP